MAQNPPAATTTTYGNRSMGPTAQSRLYQRWQLVVLRPRDLGPYARQQDDAAFAGSGGRAPFACATRASFSMPMPQSMLSSCVKNAPHEMPAGILDPRFL
jgi:hypothetical protein